MEAAASGCPVVTTNYGPLPEIMDPGFAFMSRPGDLAALANQLETLLGDEELRITMGETGARIARGRFRWDDCARSYETLFEQVLS